MTWTQNQLLIITIITFLSVYLSSCIRSSRTVIDEKDQDYWLTANTELQLHPEEG